MTSPPRVEIFTDGACSGNPGPGGWAAIFRSLNQNSAGTAPHEKEIFGGETSTTNNRMEIMAAIRALEALKMPSTVTIHTDSRYVMDGARKWMARWKANGWRTADKKPVKNEDLWHALDNGTEPHAVVEMGGRPFRPSGKRAGRYPGPLGNSLQLLSGQIKLVSSGLRAPKHMLGAGNRKRAGIFDIKLRHHAVVDDTSNSAGCACPCRISNRRFRGRARA